MTTETLSAMPLTMSSARDRPKLCESPNPTIATSNTATGNSSRGGRAGHGEAGGHPPGGCAHDRRDLPCSAPPRDGILELIPRHELGAERLSGGLVYASRDSDAKDDGVHWRHAEPCNQRRRCAQPEQRGRAEPEHA